MEGAITVSVASFVGSGRSTVAAAIAARRDIMELSALVSATTVLSLAEATALVTRASMTVIAVVATTISA